jgi:uncharacterized protein YukE
MSIFLFVRPLVDQVVSTISSQVVNASSLQEDLQTAAASVPDAWIGDDANEFAADFARRVVPGMNALISAIDGINVNLGKAINVVDSADAAASRRASGLADRFRRIIS